MSAPPPRLVAEVRSEPATAAILARLAGRPRIDSESRGVALIAVRVAAELGVEDLHHVARAALLHDVGMQFVPQELLEKPHRLTPAEGRQVARHCEDGYRILVAAGMSDEAFIALHHHERWDGMGYPCGLREDRIPLVARIMAVADACVAMTSARSYRPRRSVGDAAAELARVAGTQLDPACVAAFTAANATPAAA